MAPTGSPLSGLKSRRFAPLFATAVLGVFNDNLTKTALLMMASYGVYRADPARASELAMIAAGVFIAPFCLFSAFAGDVADRLERARIVRLIKLFEIGVLTLGAVGFFIQSIPLLLTMVALMGVHSAFYGPLKYAILPQHLRPHELLTGTGVMEAGGFLAILLGQLTAEVLRPEQAGVLGLGLAGLGFAASLGIPKTPAEESGRPDFNLIGLSWRLVAQARRIPAVWSSILAIAWFWAVGAVLLAEVVPLVQSVFHAKASVAALLLAVFSVGVSGGALLVGRLLKGEVSSKFAAPSAVALAVLLFDFANAANGSGFKGHDLSLGAFLATPAAWRILIDLAGVALIGGVFVIPFYAILQNASPSDRRSRILAANNVVNALVTAGALGASALAVKAGLSFNLVVDLLSAATLGVGLVVAFRQRIALLRAVLRLVLRLAYRVEVRGAENMPAAGEAAVVVVNHVSYIDAVILAAFLPGRPTFAVHTQIARAWWMRPVLPLFEAFPVDSTNPMSTKAMVKAVRDGKTLVIFPEGRITRTGCLMRVFAGPAMVADKAGAPIVSVRLDGPQYTVFSHLKGKVRLRAFPKVTVSVCAPRRIDLGAELAPRERRALAAETLYDIMSETIFSTSDTGQTLIEALQAARRIHGGGAQILEDVKRAPLTYDRLDVGARILAARLGETLPPIGDKGAAVGLLLPNVAPALVVFFALQRLGLVPAMLNYSAGPKALNSACQTASVQTIVSSRAFIHGAKLEGAIAALLEAGREILWLEDLAGGITRWETLAGLVSQKWGTLRPARGGDPDAAATILFTSGSEGDPKGVVLTHRNILANCAQISATVDFSPTDRVLNALPIFHSFGLTAGTLLPILNGVRCLLYPNPLHYAAIPTLAYDASATILFGSDTFLSGYARSAHPYDFYSLRYVFAGAEPVRPETRARFSEKFGVRILEGYGATECSPVIAVNTPMRSKIGSVGRLLPGLEARLETVPGIHDGGRLLVRGPNVMAGYLLNAEPGMLHPPADGWHDTGDIVSMDPEGYVTIRGRVKRFAKIGGEMVSLAACEAAAGARWPDATHAAVARPHPQRGEEIVLFTTQTAADRADLIAWARQTGVQDLALPKEIRVLDALPTLATGKTDYSALTLLIQATADGDPRRRLQEASS